MSEPRDSLSATIRRTTTVTIQGDRHLTLDFLDWQMGQGVFPLRGTSSSNGSTGDWFGTFDGDDEERIVAFFAGRKNGREAERG